MHRLLAIGVGGLLGTLARYGLSGWVAGRFGETFPTGTLVVNWSGCLVIGALFYLWEERYLVDPLLRTAVLMGFLGGFTTFSSFGLQTFILLRDGQISWALWNLLLSNLGGLFLVWAGYTLAKWI